MRLLIIDPFHGAAGDMILSALLDLGVPRQPVIQAMQSVVATPIIERVKRGGIEAVKIHTCADPIRRDFGEVVRIIRGADAPVAVIMRSERIMDRIRVAEESVHGAMTHFHELGADDAIADLIGSCMALHLLSPDKVYVLPVAIGIGTVKTEHGILPVPAPATAAILANSNLKVSYGRMGRGGMGELLTPTGAAILAEISDSSDPHLVGKLIKVGYGAGDREYPDAPNLIRMTLLETDESVGSDIVDILETNLDDISGEEVGQIIALLMKAGARDVCTIPVQMKKGRPGHLVRVIALPQDADRLAKILAKETGTLGIRCIPSVHRLIADRKIHEVSVVIKGISGKFPVKFGYLDGVCYTVKAEFDTVASFAREYKLMIREVRVAVETAAWQSVRDVE